MLRQKQENLLRDYKILSKIGVGGMGSVYLAEDLTLERQVALKILNKELINDAQFTGRFIQEARLQASLLHPNIVTLHTFFEEDNNFCMVMEYVNGMTLKDLIRKTGPIPEERTKKIFRQILEAASYAHKKGIIHRDLKPSNILIDENDFVKVLDFGIAKLLGSERFLTKIGSAAGTVYYMSPEQIRSDKHIDNRTDIYSLGITLFEMLTGRIPYKTDTDSDFQIMKEIVEVNLISPNLLNPNLSSRVCDAIKQMTEKDRTKRFATCFLISEYLEGNQENIKKYGNLPILKTKDKETSKSIYIQEPLNANQIIDFNKMDFNKINSNNIGENKPKEAIETKEFKKRLKLRKQIYIYIIIFLMILLIYFSLIR